MQSGMDRPIHALARTGPGVTRTASAVAVATEKPTAKRPGRAANRSSPVWLKNETPTSCTR
jgi:hypothetical protein